MVVTITVTVLMLLADGFLLRLRYLAGQVSSFGCALHPRGAQRWLDGVASLQLDSPEWYRPVSFSIKSSRLWNRLSLELSEVRRRREQGRAVRVYCVDATHGPESSDLAMTKESHSALVTWMEPVALEQSRLF